MWIKYPVMVAFILLVVSPAWFFKNLDKIFFKVEPIDENLITINPSYIMNDRPTDEQLAKEEHVINNLDRMISNAKSGEVRKIWEIKKAEYLNTLRWRKIEERAKGHSRIPLV